MDISISERNQDHIKRKIESGKYRSPDEVIDTALKLLDEREEQLEKLRRQLWRQIGVEDEASILDSEFMETYTPERIAEFLLNNSIDAEDYQRAREEVEKLNIDPDTIPHERRTA
jgi:putative addiction module CopG family antidote